MSQQNQRSRDSIANTFGGTSNGTLRLPNLIIFEVCQSHSVIKLADCRMHSADKITIPEFHTLDKPRLNSHNFLLQTPNKTKLDVLEK